MAALAVSSFRRMRATPWTFHGVQLVSYSACAWLSIAVTAAAQNATVKGKSVLSGKTDRLTTTVQHLYPSASSLTVSVTSGDLRGIAASIVVTTSLVGFIYSLLQNQVQFRDSEQKWVKKFVRWMSGRKVQVWSLVWAVVCWVGVVVTTAIGIVLCQRRGYGVTIGVDGVALSQEAITAILIETDLPTKYWGEGYIRFMLIAPWVQVGVVIPAVILHIMSLRRPKSLADPAHEYEGENAVAHDAHSMQDLMGRRDSERASG